MLLFIMSFYQLSDRKGMRAIIGKGLIDQGQVPPEIFMETTEQAIENVKM